MSGTLCEMLMGCPSFRHHQKAAKWALNGNDGDTEMPCALRNILKDADERGVSSVDRSALCIAYAHRLPSNRVTGGLKPVSPDVHKINTIIDSLEHDTPAWRTIRLDGLPHTVVIHSLNAVYYTYNTPTERAAAARANFDLFLLN